MCALFGVIDYGHNLATKHKTKVVSTLAQVCEVRGKDATGIAFNAGGRLNIYKRPLAARKMRFHLPGNAYTVMGHTRMATQGDEHINANNHPFRGITVDSEFALAHNGVICNDRELRQECNLPKRRLYLYASTEALLTEALAKLPLIAEKPQKIDLDQGSILRIDPDGIRTMEHFDTTNIAVSSFRRPLGIYDRFYIDELKSISHAFGYTPEDIDSLIRDGITPEEIEDYFYEGEFSWTGAYSLSPSR